MTTRVAWIKRKELYGPSGCRDPEKLRYWKGRRQSKESNECMHACMEERGERLSIHHIDYDKKNSLLSNLVAVCRVCHSKANHNREYWQKYFQRQNEVFA